MNDGDEGKVTYLQFRKHELAFFQKDTRILAFVWTTDRGEDDNFVISCRGYKSSSFKSIHEQKLL